MPFSDYGLDHLVSQELSRLSRCGAPEVTDSFPESKHWVTDFVLNFLRRAEAAFIEYDHARAALSEYVANPQRKRFSLYFRALHHFEITIAMLWQAYSFVWKVTDIPVYEKGNDSRYERLNLIYNASRKYNDKLPHNHLHHTWISNDGIHTASHSLSFEELKESLEEVGRFADRISSEP